MKTPCEVAKENGITIISEPLANISGYYNRVNGQKFIHINDRIPTNYRRYVVAHLLYGALYEPDEMMFLKEKQTTRFTETEKAANRFVVETFLDLKDCTSFRELFHKYGMTDADIQDLSKRFQRIWKGCGTEIEEQTRYVIEKIKSS